MKEPLISVIVPAYNIAAYVEKSIVSICSQTYRNIEIIVVDDGSEDDTGAILDALACRDRRIKVIHQENGGVTRARLRGAAEAAGEWIGFVDGDDYIEPQMYERLLDQARKHDADISHCGYQMVFPHGHIDYYYNTGRCELHDGNTALLKLLEGTYIEPGLWNKLYRRGLLVQLIDSSVMDETIRNTEDLLMNYYLFRQADRTVYEDTCPYHYMLRPLSAATSGISEHKLKDPMQVIRILLKETEDELEAYAIVRRKYIRELIRQATRDCTDQDKMVCNYQREMRKELRGELIQVFGSSDFSMKLKMMALWAAILPNTYGWVHRVYAGIRGFDRMYSLDK